jgi:cell division protein ZapA
VNTSTEAVSIHVLDREYTVGVVAEERASLVAAARALDAKMREIRGANRMAAIDRVAVLAALNLAHELEQLREDTERRDAELARVLAHLQGRLDALLAA